MKQTVPLRWGYLVVWEFRPKLGEEAAFEQAYGPQGPWARLFSRAPGFVATELNRDVSDARRYLTIDFWRSKQDYDAFRASHAAEYQTIDQECEALTAEEKLVGTFERLGHAAA
jgi:heme-degrading monooxygenase HmoA